MPLQKRSPLPKKRKILYPPRRSFRLLTAASWPWAQAAPNCSNLFSNNFGTMIITSDETNASGRSDQWIVQIISILKTAHATLSVNEKNACQPLWSIWLTPEVNQERYSPVV